MSTTAERPGVVIHSWRARLLLTAWRRPPSAPTSLTDVILPLIPLHHHSFHLFPEALLLANVNLHTHGRLRPEIKGSEGNSGSSLSVLPGSLLLTYYFTWILKKKAFPGGPVRGLFAFTARSTGSVPGWGTKNP